MIDIQTIKFIEFLNKMARKSEEGFYPFSTATENTGILFDDENKLSRGHRIICDCLTLNLLTGKAKKISPVMYVLAVLFVLKYLLI